MDKPYDANATTRVDLNTPVTTVGGSKLVTGVFRDRASAERAYNVVTGRGYTTSDVNVVMSDATRKLHFAANGAETELGNRASEGAGDNPADSVYCALNKSSTSPTSVSSCRSSTLLLLLLAVGLFVGLLVGVLVVGELVGLLVVGSFVG